MPTSLELKEIDHFAKDSAAWWQEDGPFAPLHRLGPLRLDYIRRQITTHFALDDAARQPFAGLRLLDIGCGGGLVSEPLARLGGLVTGIDADAQAIAVAQAHAAGMGLEIEYRACLAEDLLEALPLPGGGLGRGTVVARPNASSSVNRPPALPSPRGGEENMRRDFDVILALEVVEHVADAAFFIETAAKLCQPGGLVIVSTLNRTKRAFALGIVAAERILRWIPPGTHDWRKFLKPSELAAAGRAAGLHPADITGYGWSPRHGGFALRGADVAINYFMTFTKGAA